MTLFKNKNIVPKFTKAKLRKVQYSINSFLIYVYDLPSRVFNRNYVKYIPKKYLETDRKRVLTAFVMLGIIFLVLSFPIYFVIDKGTNLYSQIEQAYLAEKRKNYFKELNDEKLEHIISFVSKDMFEGEGLDTVLKDIENLKEGVNYENDINRRIFHYFIESNAYLEKDDFVNTQQTANNCKTLLLSDEFNNRRYKLILKLDLILAESYVRLFNYKKAEPLLENCYRFLKEFDSIYDKFTVLKNYGILCRELGKYEKAIKAFEEARKYKLPDFFWIKNYKYAYPLKGLSQRELSDFFHVEKAQVALELVFTLEKLNSYEIAKTELEKLRFSSDTITKTVSQLALGHLYKKNSNQDSAIMHFDTLKNILKTIQIPSSVYQNSPLKELISKLIEREFYVIVEDEFKADSINNYLEANILPKIVQQNLNEKLSSMIERWREERIGIFWTRNLEPTFSTSNYYFFYLWKNIYSDLSLNKIIYYDGWEKSLYDAYNYRMYRTAGNPKDFNSNKAYVKIAKIIFFCFVLFLALYALSYPLRLLISHIKRIKFIRARKAKLYEKKQERLRLEKERKEKETLQRNFELLKKNEKETRSLNDTLIVIDNTKVNGQAPSLKEVEIYYKDVLCVKTFKEEKSELIGIPQKRGNYLEIFYEDDEIQRIETRGKIQEMINERLASKYFVQINRGAIVNLSKIDFSKTNNSNIVLKRHPSGAILKLTKKFGDEYSSRKRYFRSS